MEPMAPYTILTREEFLKEMQKLTQLTAADLGISESMTKLMLNIYNWDEKTLTAEHNRAADKEAFFEEKKIATGKPKAPAEGEKCQTCDSEKFCKMSPCGCFFCVGCWSRYFWKEINLKQSVLLTCIGCSHFADEQFISQTFEEFNKINDVEYIGEYAELNANQKKTCAEIFGVGSENHCQSMRNPFVESCPQSTCSKIIKVNKAGPCIVKCTCKRTFCFACTKYRMLQSVVHYSPSGKTTQLTKKR